MELYIRVAVTVTVSDYSLQTFLRERAEKGDFGDLNLADDPFNVTSVDLNVPDNQYDPPTQGRI